VAFYLETPGMEDGYDAVNIARMGDLATRRPLTPRPDGMQEKATSVADGIADSATAASAGRVVAAESQSRPGTAKAPA
jgi:hypothetical protein